MHVASTRTLAAAVLLLTSTALADPPASRPAIDPASVLAAKPSPDSPLGAIKLSRMIPLGLISGDLHDVLHVTTPTQKKLLDAMADEASGQFALLQAATTHFGPDKAGPLTQLTADEALARLQQSAPALAQPITVKQAGDKAQVSTAGQGDPIDLVRIDGKWKLIGQLPEPSNPSEADLMTEMSRVNAKVSRDIAAQIKSGKFKDAQEANTALETQRAQAIQGLMSRAMEKAQK